MLTKSEEFIKNIQKEYNSYFKDGDPEKPLTRAGKGAINPTRALLDNFTEYNRFIEEMIQNAEDSESTEIIFHINKDKIIIENNGKPFDKADVSSIAIVGDSTKQDSGSIGMFGLGFKSVFLLSDNPLIHSGEFHFSFNSKTYIYPCLEEYDSSFDKKRTYVILPLKEYMVSEILESVRKHYSQVGELILFLKNLKKIQIKDHELGEIIFEKKKIEDRTLIYKTHNGQTQLKSKWLIKNKEFKISKYAINSLKEDDRRRKGKPIYIDLAFELNKQSNELINRKDKKLYSFLATKYNTNLPFIINSDFHLTGDRERIKEDSSWNKFIFESAFELFKETIDYLKDSKTYRATFYGIIPESSKCPPDRDFLMQFYEKVMSYCKTAEIILTESNTFKKAEDCFFDDEKISNVITNNIIFSTYKKEFVSSKIPGDYRFLIAKFGVKYFSKTKIIEFLEANSQYLQSLSDEMLTTLYSKLYEIFEQELVESLEQVELIKIEDSKELISFKEVKETPIFYKAEYSQTKLFDIEGININYISHNLWKSINKSEDKQVEYFIRELRDRKLLKKFDLNSYIESLLLGFEKSEDDSLIETTLFIRNKFKQLSPDTKKLVILNLKLKTKSDKWCKPKNVFYPEKYINDDLFEILSQISELELLSNEYLKVDKDKSQWVEFFNEIGLNKTLPIVKHDRHRGGVDHGQENISCPFLSKVFKKLKNIDIKKRIIIGKKILKNLDDNWAYYKDHLFIKDQKPIVEMGEVVDYETSLIQTEFLKTLKENCWVPNTGNDLLPPTKVFTNTELIKNHDKTLPRINIGLTNKNLIESLGIKDKLDVEVYIASLRNLKKNKKTTNYSETERLYSNIYASLKQSSHKKKEDIKELFDNDNLIFLPSKNNPDFWTNSVDSFLHQNKLVKNYLFGIKDLYDNKNCLKFFEEFLEIKEQPNASNYLQVIDQIKLLELNKGIKEDVLRIYTSLSQELEEETPYWWEEFSEGEYLLSTRDNFCNKKDILIDDENNKISSLYEEDVDFLFLPLLTIKPRINNLLEKLELSSLSEEIKEKVISSNSLKKSLLRGYHKKVNLFEKGIKEYLIKHYNKEIDGSVSFSEIFLNFVETIEVNLDLKGIKKSDFFEQYYEEKSKTIYLKKNKGFDLKFYKKPLSNAIAKIYDTPTLADHIYKLIQECIIDRVRVIDFYYEEGITITDDEINLDNDSEERTIVRKDKQEKDSEKELIQNENSDELDNEKDEEKEKKVPEKEHPEIKYDPDIEKDKREYFKTKKWAKLRKEVLVNADYTCKKCHEKGIEKGGTKILQAHHLIYERFGDELLEDLICLCKECHEKTHDKKFNGLKKKQKEEHIKNIQKKEKEHDELSERINKGRTESPDNETNFINRMKIRKPKPSNPETVITENQPLSLEEKKEIEEKIRQELNQEIKEIRSENKKRTYKNMLKPLSKKEDVNLEVKNYYNGKCQICGSTFKSKKGENYCEIVEIIPKRYGGVRFSGNKLCLCPNHAAIIKHGDFDPLEFAEIDKNNLTIRINYKKAQIKYHKEHMLALKLLLKY